MKGAARAWNGFARSIPGGASPPARFARSMPRLTGELRGLATYGGLLIHDRQIVSPERLVLGVLAAAVAAGAIVCNRLEAKQILVSGGQVVGARARDHVANRQLEIRSDRVINAAGPWATELWPEESGPRPPIGFARGVHLVIDHPPPPLALGLPWNSQSADGRWNRARRVFVMPWAGITLAGASWQPVLPPLEQATGAIAKEVDEFRTGFETRWPELGLTPQRTRFVSSGIYPLFGADAVRPDRYAVARHPFLQHHADVGGPEGLVTAIGVKLTTARALAERILDDLVSREDLELRPCTTARAGPLPGATPATVTGIGFEPIRDPSLARRLAQVAAEREQAGSLADLFLRRSVAGQFGLPTHAVLQAAAGELGRTLDWSAARVHREICDFENLYEVIGARYPEMEDST
jgi:glycerol-3-phosphate dehydrogenase